jgi:type I restriction enzyme S subunit
MSSLNYLEKLLNGVEVEWKPLGDVGEFIRGNGLQKSDFTESGISCIHYGQIYTFYGNFAYETKSFVSSALAVKLRKAQKGDLIIATTSENIEDVCKPLVWLGEDEVCVSGETYIFKHNQNSKYLSYCLQTPVFFEYKKRHRTGTKVIRVHGDKLAEFQIPIPPLAIQSEIVRILDNFTELTAELTAELTVRKKQYNYYRDRLLSFEDEGIEWKTLGELAEYSKTRINFEQLDKTNYVGVDNLLQNLAGKTESNYVPTSGNLTQYCEGDILVGNIRPYLKKIWQADRVGGTNGDVLVIHLTDDVVNARYLYQVLADEKFFEYNMQHAKGAKMPRGDKDKIMEYRFQVPKNPDEQARIAFILDKFETLTNSMTEGLPREIALRQKQYEHYRDLLLSFPKSQEVAA